MPNPILPGVPENEQALLYAKLNEYNRGRSSFKEVGIYLVVLPRPGKPNYTLWFYDPSLEKNSFLYIDELSPAIYTSLRTASTMLYYSKRCIAIVEYNEKRMQSNGEDIIFFGKYRGHFLHQILMVDPAYLNWIAYKFNPQIPKQKRFVEIARAYHSVYLDTMLRVTKETHPISRHLGVPGEKLTNLKLKVMRVRLEDDPYKTRVYGTTPQYYVKQVLTLTDPSGNLLTWSVSSTNPSGASCHLSSMEHEYRPGEMIYAASAQIVRVYESRGYKYTRINRVKLMELDAFSNRP